MSWGSLISAGASLIGSYLSSKDAEDQAEDQAELQRQTAEYNRNLSLYDAGIMLKKAGETEKATGDMLVQHVRAVNKVTGQQKTRYAKSGVMTTKGSALDIIVQSKKRAREDYQKILYEGKKKVRAAITGAERYKKMAEYGFRSDVAQADLTQQAGAAQANAMRWQAASKFASQVYEIGSDEGWWS